MSSREYLKMYFESELYIEWVYLIFRSDYYLSRSRKIKFRNAWRIETLLSSVTLVWV